MVIDAPRGESVSSGPKASATAVVKPVKAATTTDPQQTGGTHTESGGPIKKKTGLDGQDKFEMKNTLGSLGEDETLFKVADKAGDGKTTDGKVDGKDMDNVITLAGKAKKGELKVKHTGTTSDDNDDNNGNTGGPKDTGNTKIADDGPEYTEEEVDSLKRFADTAGGGENLETHRTELVSATTDSQYDKNGDGGISFVEAHNVFMIYLQEKKDETGTKKDDTETTGTEIEGPTGNPFGTAAVMSCLSKNSTMFKMADGNSDGTVTTTEVNTLLGKLQQTTDLGSNTNEAIFLREIVGISQSKFNQLEENQKKELLDTKKEEFKHVKDIRQLNAAEITTINGYERTKDNIAGLSIEEAASTELHKKLSGLVSV